VFVAGYHSCRQPAGIAGWTSPHPFSNHSDSRQAKRRHSLTLRRQCPNSSDMRHLNSICPNNAKVQCAYNTKSEIHTSDTGTVITICI